MMEPLISVIVPVYNVENFLPKCVESILSQSEKNLELILVDDGSKDNSPSICDDFKKKDSRITVIHKKNGGVSSARNTGLDKAKGKYITFVDSDDWLDPETYEKALKENIKTDAEIVCWRASFEGNFDDMADFDETGLIDLSVHNAHELFACAVWNKMILRSMIDKYSIRFHKEGSYGEDNCFNIKCFSAANKILGINERLYHYIFRAGSLVRNFSDEKNMNLAECIKDLEEFIDLNNLHSEIIDRFVSEKKLEAKTNYISRLNSPKKFKELFPETNEKLQVSKLPLNLQKIAAYSLKGKNFSASLLLYKQKYLTKKNLFAIISKNRFFYTLILFVKATLKTRNNSNEFNFYCSSSEKFKLIKTNETDFTDLEKEMLFQSTEDILFLRTIKFLFLEVSRIENRRENKVLYISRKQKNMIEEVFFQKSKIGG